MIAFLLVRILNRVICHLSEHEPCDATDPLFCQRCWRRLYPADRFDVFEAT